MDSPVIKRMQEMVADEEKYRKAIRELKRSGGVLKDVAKKYGLSASGLQRRFVEYTGVNYMTYLKQNSELRKKHRWWVFSPTVLFWVNKLKEDPLLTFADVAKELGITRERVRQIYTEHFGTRKTGKRCKHDWRKNGIFVPEEFWPEPLKLFVETLPAVMYVKRPLRSLRWFFIKARDGRAFIFTFREEPYTVSGGYRYFSFSLRKSFPKILNFGRNNKKYLILACKLNETWHFCDFDEEVMNFLRDKSFIQVPFWMVKSWKKLKSPQISSEKSAFM